MDRFGQSSSFQRGIAFGGVLGCAMLALAAPKPSGAPFARYLESPAGFEANAGQGPAGSEFVSHSLGHSVYLDKAGARLDLNGGPAPATLNLSFAGAQGNPKAAGADPLKVKSSYFWGADPGKWLQGITNYGKVRYQGVWPGIDVVYYGTERQLEYDFVVAPGANPRLAMIDVGGTGKLSLNGQGDLVVQTPAGEVVQKQPVAWQKTAGGRSEVAARYTLSGRRVSVELGAYDHSAELIIDPVLAFSYTRLDSTFTSGNAIASDGSGNFFAVGTTAAVGTGGTGLFTTAWLVGYDRFGTGQIKFTVGATDGNVTGKGVAVDNAANVYITGSVAAPHGFLLQNAFQTALAGPSDAYLSKFHIANGTASVAFSTYLGGSGAESGNAVAVDNAGNAYLAGSTASADFPKNQGNGYAGGSDAFVAKLNTNVSGTGALSYAFLAGGTSEDSANAIALDSSNNLYVAGNTASATFRPTGATGYVTTKSNPNVDGFLMKLNATSLAMGYFTFYSFGPISALAVDAAGNAYVTGTTTGQIPTNSLNAGFQLSSAANEAFLTRFNTTVNGVNSLVYASTLGGSGLDTGLGVATGGAGDAVITGLTTSSNFPVTGSPFASTLSGPSDGYVARFNTNASGGPSLTFSSYLGGSGADSLNAVTLSPYGNPIVTGQTASPNFPVPPGGTADPGTDTRAIAAKILLEGAPFGSLDVPVNNGTNLSGALNAGGWALSSVAIANIALWRDPLPGEATSPNGLVFLTNASQVAGARPDVAGSYPGYPNNNYGWGVQILTNQLPGTGGKTIGNGSYKVHAIATDSEGLSAELGSSSFSTNNAGSTLPFGTIDTPKPGEVISGAAYANFGWVVTPQPATVPKDGSTISVFIDNVAVGHPVYNNYRQDIATLFPNLMNSGGAVAYYFIDSTKLANGLHTISWTVQDNAGHANGLGSRYFIVQN